MAAGKKPALRRRPQTTMDKTTGLPHRITQMIETQPLITEEKDALKVVYDAVESAIEGIIITDLGGRITYVNFGFLRMFRYVAEEELIGRNIADLFVSAEIRKFSDLSALIDAAEGEKEEFLAVRADSTEFFVEVHSSNVTSRTGQVIGRMAFFVDISRRKKVEQEKDVLVRKLQEALDNIKTLRGLIPICAGCKKVRDDKGFWHQVEEYVHRHSEARFSHGLCPDCVKRLYPELAEPERNAPDAAPPDAGEAQAGNS
ncbi:MAG: PAS domain S-box protein [Kiritimatiellae bacterium]|nr:PAS domain S-box protein [Kiritimatiellia bacterium]